MITHDNGNACKRKGYTFSSGSSSKLRWVAEVFSLCLDCKEKKKGTKRREINKYACGVGYKKALRIRKKMKKQG